MAFLSVVSVGSNRLVTLLISIKATAWVSIDIDQALSIHHDFKMMPHINLTFYIFAKKSNETKHEEKTLHAHAHAPTLDFHNFSIAICPFGSVASDIDRFQSRLGKMFLLKIWADVSV